MAKTSRVSIAELVEEGGVAANAERLIDAVYGSRPGQLVKAISLPHHARVHAGRRAENPQYEVPETPRLGFEEVEAAAGLDQDPDTHVVAAALHGSDLGHAWVVYVAQDAAGSHFKGAYPFEDHGQGEKSVQHVSEAEHFAESEAGKMLAERRAAQADEPVKTTRRTRRPPAAEDAGDDAGSGDEPGSGDASE